MIKNPYSAQPCQNNVLLPHPKTLQFLKMYSKSIDVVKGKKAMILLVKN